MALSDPIPKFRLGDRVISHRGETAVIIHVRQVDIPGKSHRVSVQWTDEFRNPDKTEYYEEVFTRHDDPIP